MLSDAARSIWAKTDKSGQGRWLSLAQHLADTAAVCGHLWDEWLPGAVRTRLAVLLGVPEEDARKLALFLAAVHDIGKATPDFARQAQFAQPEFLTRMARQGLTIPSPLGPERLGHQVSGQRILRTWLVDRYGIRPSSADSLAAIIGGHHGVYPADATLNLVDARSYLIGGGVWESARHELLEHALETADADDVLSKVLASRAPVQAQMLLTALIIAADWIASNEELFPYSDPLPTEERLTAAMQALALPGPWTPAAPIADAADLMAQRFPVLAGSAPRPIQSTLYQLVLTNETPGLYILEEAMGGGKTEAALMSAEALAAGHGLGGVFVALPTMATSNPMFSRVLAWLETAVGERNASVALMHGKAALNEEFDELRAQEWRGELYDDSHTSGHAVVNSWLLGRKRTVLSSFVVGTIDQTLFAALKAKHVVLRHLGLAGKVVIIDEVHAADDYMRAYLKSALAWLGACRTPVILMSATLPPEQRDELINAYAGGTGDRRRHQSDRTDIYPRITAYTDDLVNVQVASPTTSYPVQLRRIDDAPVALAEKLAELLDGGGCAGVICNTVSRAQEVYRHLRDVFDHDVVLCHSRFIATDRSEREAEIVSLLGRDGSVRPDRLILVGTQVLEQSLDIDFDLLVTDLAPIDLMLQRVGRLHRHQRTRPPALERTQLLIRGVKDWRAAPIEAIRGSSHVYGADRLMRAAAVLQERDNLNLPFDIPLLVRSAYDQELPAPVGWNPVWDAAEAKAGTKRACALQRAGAFLLAPPQEVSKLNGLIEVVAGDPEDAKSQGRSQVRDSDEGLEVIALFRDEAGILRLPDSAPRFAGSAVPTDLAWVPADEPLAKAMSACTLPLPAVMCLPHSIDAVIAALESQTFLDGWQSSRWLAGQLALVFDTQGNASVADYELHYDHEEGLVFQQMEKSR